MMPDTARRSSRFAFLLVVFVVFSILVLSAPAHALTNIRDVYWTTWDGMVPGRVVVLFDADVTIHDLEFLHFTIKETNDQAPLTQFTYPSTGISISPGMPVTVAFEFRTRCTDSGALEISAQWLYVGFCSVSAGNIDDPDLNGPWVGNVGSGGAFSMAVADENGTVAGDVAQLQCGSAPNSPGPPLVDHRALLQDRLDRLAENGDSGTLGIYFDQAGTVCTGEILPGQPRTVYVVAKLAGVTACGIQGGEFRFSGVPENWTIAPVPREDMLGIGNPFTNGVSFGLPSCQQPENASVVLYSVLVIANEYVPDVMFQILPRVDPSNDKFNCAFLHMCDAVAFGRACMDVNSCYVNPSVPKACSLPTAVEPSTWGAVKRLFRGADASSSANLEESR